MDTSRIKTPRDAALALIRSGVEHGASLRDIKASLAGFGGPDGIEAQVGGWFFPCGSFTRIAGGLIFHRDALKLRADQVGATVGSHSEVFSLVELMTSILTGEA